MILFSNKEHLDQLNILQITMAKILFSKEHTDSRTTLVEQESKFSPDVHTQSTILTVCHTNKAFKRTICLVDRSWCSLLAIRQDSKLLRTMPQTFINLVSGLISVANPLRNGMEKHSLISAPLFRLYTQIKLISLLTSKC